MNLKEIKDAARQAFRDQQTQDTEGGVPDAVSFIAGFLEGSRHLQSAFDDRVRVIEMQLEDKKKLVNALKFYANKNNPNFIVNLDYHDETDCDFHEDTQLTHFGKLARQVLKEIGEE